MPQINQLSAIFFSQLFWLAVVFGIIYFVIGRGMVPKIQATMDARDNKIASELAAAEQARADADATEKAWRERMDAARAEAARIAQEAKRTSALDTEAKIKQAGDKIDRKVDSAEAKIRDAVNAARAEIETVAADATREMVARLTGIKVEAKEAAQAVKAEFNV